MKVSVVINTYNRANSLRDAIESLRYLDGPDFEVIVVNGPSTDDTDSVLEAYSSIRVGRCTARNLSMSRNVGLEMARGEIVAFIDDDALADRFWLRDLVRGYDAPDIGGVGGVVYDYPKVGLQYGFICMDRYGNARVHEPAPLTDCCFPGALLYPGFVGTNASFRRDLLLEIDGFDEEFEYHLDETDVCVRLVDAGYRLRQVPTAIVYHRYLPSDYRGSQRMVTYWYPIIKNKIYFSLKNAGSQINLRSIMRDAEQFALQVERDLQEHVQAGNLEPGDLEQFKTDAEAAFRDGLERGLSHPRRFKRTGIAAEARDQIVRDVNGCTPDRFRSFPSLRPSDGRLTICLLSQQSAPVVTYEIGRYIHELARGMAKEGHDVHVLTPRDAEQNSVRFEDGVWVHSFAPDDRSPPPPEGTRIPVELRRHSERIFREILRIDDRHPVDIVDGPACYPEGVAAVLDGRFTTVTSLATPLMADVKANPRREGARKQSTRFNEIKAAERIVVTGADGVRAISSAVLETLPEEYRRHLEPNRVRVIPLDIRGELHTVAPRMVEQTIDFYRSLLSSRATSGLQAPR